MSEFIITSEQLKTATEAYLERELSRPITDVFISGDKLPEIVRCRDCENARVQPWNPITRTGLWCVEHDIPIDSGGFCAWGERGGA